VDTFYREIIIKGEFTLYIPNAFTPNNDGQNDLFFAQGYGITDMQIMIFNRWGNPVFEGNSLTSKWNGRKYNSGEESPQGVYVYKLKVKDMYGQFHSFDGRVTLLK
jgi:gliding motility-associated-like protein